MPVTPFHWGPGLLLKAAAPRAMSLTAFAATQVAIDVESSYYLLQGAWPVHRTLHTFLWGSMAGLAVGVALSGVGRVTGRERVLGFEQELALGPAVVGGLLGGSSHALLDGIMHADIQPLEPFAAGNPLHGLIGLGALHLVCVAAGIVGWVWLQQRRMRRGVAA